MSQAEAIIESPDHRLTKKKEEYEIERKSQQLRALKSSGLMVFLEMKRNRGRNNQEEARELICVHLALVLMPL